MAQRPRAQFGATFKPRNDSAAGDLMRDRLEDVLIIKTPLQTHGFDGSGS
jgi:hypothetical protein